MKQEELKEKKEEMVWGRKPIPIPAQELFKEKIGGKKKDDRRE